MPIRISSSCTNCEALSAGSHCQVHDVQVNEHYTCDQFSLKAQLSAQRQCKNCARFKTQSCAHPNKAAEGMLCASWAPQA